MFPIVLPEVSLLANTWTPIELPDKVRDSIRFQAKSLGVLDYSFDAGISYMQTVGAGDQLMGNFSSRTIWFRVTTNDSVKILCMDRLY